MALDKERTTRNAQHGSIQDRGGPLMQGFDGSPLEFLAFKGKHSTILEDGYTMGHLPTLSDLSSNGLTFGVVTSPMREAPPMANSFKTGHWAYSSSSVLSFEQGDRASDPSYSKLVHEEEGANWIEAMDHDYQVNDLNSKCGANSRLARDANCTEMASVYGSRGGTTKDGQHGEERLGLLYSDLAAVDNLEEGWGQDSGSQKRAYMGDDMHAHKKHCGNGKKAKASTPTKEPQSIAAKNRRERISDRLRVLQELVPNGTKVDLVTMLEKAISHVKFLQLQVKVLATDEFWPTQGGKAPEVAQVKEAIDAILASNREKP